MKNLLQIAIVFYLIMMVNILNGQSIVTDRPDQTESAITVPVRSFQIETGMSLGYSSDDKTKYRTFSGPSSLFRVGLLTGVELRITNQFESTKNLKKENVSAGISDMMLGAKVELINKEDINAKIAILSHLVLPTGSSDLTTNRYGTVNRLAVSHNLTDNMGLGYNIGYDYFGEGSGNLVYTMSLGFSVTDRLGVFVEGYGELVDFKDSYLNFDSGFTYLIRNNLQFDFSFASGINHYMNYISTGISWNIGGYNKD